MVVKTKAKDGHDLWDGLKAKDRFLNSSTQSNGQRKRGQKGKHEGEKGRGGFKMKRPVNSIKYLREASEVEAGSNYQLKESVTLKESSYSGEVGVEVRLASWEYAGSE